MSSRHRLKVTNDIFDMIADNDPNVQFDHDGILKVMTHSKSTHVMVRLPSTLDRRGHWTISVFRPLTIMFLVLLQFLLACLRPIVS